MDVEKVISETLAVQSKFDELIKECKLKRSAFAMIQLEMAIEVAIRVVLFERIYDIVREQITLKDTIIILKYADKIFNKYCEDNESTNH